LNFLFLLDDGKRGRASVGKEDTAKALQRAVSAFAKSQADDGSGKRKGESDDYLGDLHDPKASQSKKSKPSVRDMDESDDGDDGFHEKSRVSYDDEEFGSFKEGKNRRRAPEGPMDEDDVYEQDDSEGLLEDFAKKKRAFAAKKKEHYAAEERYGGLIENVPESGKRAATYEIMKNKGLTPHRKKENRNPRVKKRMAYEKAIVARKGQVREVTAGAAGKYDGELTGIKANISRSRKIGN
jgi:hypothetical protein